MLKQKISVSGSTPIDHTLASPSAEPVSPAQKSHSNTNIHSYNRYFASGSYKVRYPKVNQHTLHFINHYLKKRQANAHILDYGCGNGRYLITLLSEHTKARFTAYDIALVPLKILRKKLVRLKATQRVKIVHDHNDLIKGLEAGSTIDIALLLFGVLSHIESASQRYDLLCYLRDSILPSCGKLILSVPNKNRRFLALQRQQKSRTVKYTREIGKVKNTFFYHLYTTETIKKELAKAGLEVINMHAESVLPETWVSRFSLLGRIDQYLCKYVPASWGYGILLSCQPSQ